MYQPTRSRRITKAKTTERAELRHVVVHDYHDHSNCRPASLQSCEEDDHNHKRSGPRGGVNVPFPTKLHIMLSKVEAEGLTDIVGWQPHGRCFIIHKPREFVNQVMPEYFRQSKLTSFQRQLNLYGFRRLTTGADRGGYYHEMFLKHKLFLCRSMTRMRIKGTGIKGKASPETEPNFYAMPEIRPDDDQFNQRIELEVLTAIEEEEGQMSSSPRGKKSIDRMVNAQKSGWQSNRSGVMKASKKKKKSLNGNQSPTLKKSFKSPALISPEAQYPKAPVSFEIKSSIFNGRHICPDSANSQFDLIDLALPLHKTQSNHSLLSDYDYQHDDRISFEGQHFHYLDSLAVHEMVKTPPLPISLGRRYSSTISLPQLTATISGDDPNDDTCNPEVVSSASSIDTPQGQQLAQYPTKNIIRESDRGSWSIDIDQEFLLMDD